MITGVDFKFSAEGYTGNYTYYGEYESSFLWHGNIKSLPDHFIFKATPSMGSFGYFFKGAQGFYAEIKIAFHALLYIMCTSNII